jgi:hypothetical protein
MKRVYVLPIAVMLFGLAVKGEPMFSTLCWIGGLWWAIRIHEAHEEEAKAEARRQAEIRRDRWRAEAKRERRREAKAERREAKADRLAAERLEAERVNAERVAAERAAAKRVPVAAERVTAEGGELRPRRGRSLVADDGPMPPVCDIGSAFLLNAGRDRVAE